MADLVPDKNFVMLTQIVTNLGIEKSRTQKIYPHDKEFLMRKLRMRIKDVPGGFWADLYQKDEAKLEDKFGGVVHFQIQPINGDYVDEAEINKISKRD